MYIEKKNIYIYYLHDVPDAGCTISAAPPLPAPNSVPCDGDESDGGANQVAVPANAAMAEQEADAPADPLPGGVKQSGTAFLALQQ